MALSRAEIELLIKARSDADKAFQDLANNIKRVTGESTTATQGMTALGDKTKGSGTAAIATGVAFGTLADSLARGLVNAFQDTIAAANRLDAGLIGLRSVASAFKQDAGLAEEAAKRLASDGLMSVGEAAAGLKNLLAAGFGLDQAITLMGRFKDSAAFGRQGALDFGQAIVGATEGIKNGNCLVGETPVLVEGGRWVPIGDLFRAGAPVNVYSLRTNGALGHTRVAHVVDNGERDVFELALASGKRVTATANHRFLSPTGWRFLEQLAPGDELLTIDPLDSPTPWRNPASSVSADFASSQDALRRLASAAVRAEAPGGVPTVEGHWRRTGGADLGPSSLLARARSAALQSTRSLAFIDAGSLACARQRVAAFVARSVEALVITDGWRACAVGASGATVSWTSCPAWLAPSASVPGPAGTGGRARYAWLARITPTGRAGKALRRLLCGRRRPTRRGVWRSLRAIATAAGGAIARSAGPTAMPTIACAWPTPPSAPSTSTTARPCAGAAIDVYTLNRDTVVSITAAGRARVYDLNVPETENFIAAGVVSHNSALVDNAGVTKNLSVLLTEAGFKATDLGRAQSDLGVRTAIYNGILKETNPQLGDAARYLDTAAGKQAQFSAQVEIAQQKIGKALQPALTAATAALVPFVEVIGDAAPVIVPVGAALAGMAIPIVALRAASAIGISSLSDLRGAFTVTQTSAETTSRALQAVSLAQKGLFLAGVITAGYQAAEMLGEYAVEARKAADESDGLVDSLKAYALEVASFSNPVSSFLVKQKEMTESLGLLKGVLFGVSTELPKFKDATGEVVGAMGPFQTAAEQATRALAFQPKTFADLQQLQRDFDAAGQGADASRKRIVEWKSEIQALASRGALTDLRTELELGVRSNKELSDSYRISEDAIKFYEKGLKDSAAASKDATREQREREKAIREERKALDELNQSLEQAGVITAQGLNEKLRELESTLAAAGAVSTPALATAVRTLSGEFLALEARAKASGLAVDGVRMSFDSASAAAGLVFDPGFEQSTDRGIDLMIEAAGGVKQIDFEAIRARMSAEQLAAAYAAFGLKTPSDLKRVADESRRNYEVLLSSGTATTQQLTAAYDRMIADQRAATGRLPGVWETEVFPRIKSTVEQLNTALQGTFAQMLLGAKGFKDGFTDIWESLKASVTRILADLLSTFVNRFLKGMLGAMSGQQGAFGSAFAGLFGGGGGLPGMGGGVGFPGLPGGLFGGGAPLNSPAIAQAGLGLPASGGGLFGIGGLTASGLLGGLGAGGAGFGLGRLGQHLFGGAGAGAGIFGGLGGFGTGAAIGSIVPGIGTLVGGLIGGAAGLFGGLIGQSQGMKANDVRDLFLAQYGGAGTGEGSGFHTVAAQLTDATGQHGGGDLFNRLIKANTVKEVESAILAVVAALEKQKATAAEAAAATSASSAELSREMETQQAQADRLQARIADVARAREEARRTGGNTEELDKQWEQLQYELQLVQQRMREIRAEQDAIASGGEAAASSIGSGFEKTGETVDALKAKAAALQDEIDRVAAAGGDTRELNKQMQALQTIIGAAGSTTRLLGGELDTTTESDGDVDRLGRSFYNLWRDIERAYQGTVDLSDALAGLPTAPSAPGGAPGPVEGGAAAGVYATRPGLVLFGEGGQPEVGGPRSFFKQVFDELGVGSGAGPGAGGVTTIVPMAFFLEGRTGFDGAAINAHLASVAGVRSNAFDVLDMFHEIIDKRIALAASRA